MFLFEMVLTLICTGKYKQNITITQQLAKQKVQIQ